MARTVQSFCKQKMLQFEFHKSSLVIWLGMFEISQPISCLISSRAYTTFIMQGVPEKSALSNQTHQMEKYISTSCICTIVAWKEKSCAFSPLVSLLKNCAVPSKSFFLLQIASIIMNPKYVLHSNQIFNGPLFPNNRICSSKVVKNVVDLFIALLLTP